MHAVNVLGSISLFGMLIQLLLTFLVGITLACLALEIENILPLIIYHALWDFLLIAESAAGAEYGILPAIQVSFEIAMGFVLLFILKKETRS